MIIEFAQCSPQPHPWNIVGFVFVFVSSCQFTWNGSNAHKSCIVVSGNGFGYWKCRQLALRYSPQIFGLQKFLIIKDVGPLKKTYPPGTGG